MKNIKNTIVAFFAFLLTGCTKSDLTLNDPDNVVETNYYQSEKDAISGLAGVYSAYQSNGLMGEQYREFDHASDNAYTYQSTGWQFIEQSTQTSATPLITNFWQAYYTVISRANTLIAKVRAMSGNVIADSSRNRIIAEASFLRDYAYCDLTALWGNVPLYLTPLDAFSEPLGASTVNSIYDTMVTDLKGDIIPNLPTTIDADDKGRVARGAALFLLGKYYMYMKDYAAAAAAFKQIIDSKVYTLYPDYAKLFTEEGEFSSESLFEINFTGNSLDAGESFSARIDTTAAAVIPLTWWLPTESLVNSYLCTDGRPITQSTLYGNTSVLYSTNSPYANRDPRLAATVYTKADTLSTGKVYWKYSASVPYAVKKYTVKSKEQYTNGGPQNYYVIRYADVLLMYAEAENELNGAVESVYTAVNQVRERVKMPDYPANLTQDEMRQRIRDERCWEFALEQQRYFDILRWGIAQNVIPSVGHKKVFTNPKDYLWPYPQTEIDRNAALRAQGQNPGYN